MDMRLLMTAVCQAAVKDWPEVAKKRSVAGVAGAGREGYAERAAHLFRIAGLLKRYADQYQLAVVVTNQARHGALQLLLQTR